MALTTPRPAPVGHRARPDTGTRRRGRLAAAMTAAALLIPGALAGAAPALAEPVDEEVIECIDFTDNPEGSAFYWEVLAMGCLDLSQGYRDGSFGKQRQVTRGETSSFLYRLAADPAYAVPKKKVFKDVPVSSAHHAAISWMSSEGYATGYADKTYGLNRAVTRGEAAKMLYNVYGIEHIPDGKRTFKDVKAGDEFYRYIDWFEEAGLVSGYQDDTFKPGRSITRGELAKLMIGALEYVLETEEWESPEPLELLD